VLHQLHDSKAKFLLTIGMFLEKAQAAAKGEGSKVEQIYTFDGAEGSTPFKALFGAESVDAQVELDAGSAVVALPYSSGTTGASKGVMLTHRNLLVNILQCRASGVKFEATESFVCVLPFFHIYGMQVLLNTGLYSGCVLITVPRFDLVQFLELNQKHKCSWMFIVPPIVLALASHPIIDKYQLTSLKTVFSGAAPLGGDIAAKAAARLKVNVCLLFFAKICNCVPFMSMYID
jgi:acyl-CoA synthetase (AMP-forming)/AMP-acid ligase II